VIRKRYFLLFFFLLSLDVLSKIWVLQSVPGMGPADRFYPFGGIGIFSDFFGVSFSLNFIVNTGAAWGIFAGHSGLLFGLRAAIMVGLVLYLTLFHRGHTPKFPLWLVVTGALGNAIDYALYGHVIDFLHFVFWGHTFPIFNFADSYITLGVFGLMFFSRKAKRQMAL
jgi:signal peptidase II